MHNHLLTSPFGGISLKHYFVFPLLISVAVGLTSSVGFAANTYHKAGYTAYNSTGASLSGTTSVSEYDPEETMTREQETETLDTSSVTSYIMTDYSKLQQFTNESEYTTRTRQQLISYAMQFIGNPYVWGGTSLTKGADCSGFVQQIFAHFGATTGRTSRDQYANCLYLLGSEVMPGDLVFYADGNYINHVAIYAGNNLIIHAANSRTGIKVSRYDYRRPYAYGRFLFT